MAPRDIDASSGTETTGHQWDGIKELDTPLPRWWLWTFYATIVWSVGYCIAYPAWPLISTVTPGLLGYSSRAELAVEVDAAAAARSVQVDRIAALDLQAIAADRDLADFARAGGASAFAVNCSQCHGSGAAGAAGYPNLNDDDWLWGGTLDDIYRSIAHGIRFEGNDETRFSQMPAFGRDGLLNRGEIADLVEHVLALSHQEHDPTAARRGAELFADNCAVCHGETGGGDRAAGAPRLSDPISLYAGDADAIRAQVADPSHGVMPAWAHRLDDATIKQLAIFVHSLGGGE
jgi:cytochrome c oxidase cbb3-type subunit III